MMGTPLGARTVSYGRPPCLVAVGERGVTCPVSWCELCGRAKQASMRELAHLDSSLRSSECAPGLRPVLLQAFGDGRATGGRRIRRRAMRGSLLPRRGSFSVSLSPSPTPHVGGGGGQPPRSAFDSQFTMGAGGLRAEDLQRGRHMSRAETAKGSSVPVIEASSVMGY